MRKQLALLLARLEQELQAQGRWDRRPPPRQALLSTEPFAVDSLAFDQWLQWILLPKLRQLLAQQLPLPSNCAIGPMAEAVYAPADADAQRLIAIISEIDLQLTDPDQAMR